MIQNLLFHQKIRIFLIIPVALFLLSFLPKTVQGQAWYNASWTYRKAITIDYTKVGTGTHANFPVLISIIDANLKTGAQTNSNDILFTSADGTTKLAHEIESYTSASGTLVAWVKIPSLSSSANTIIYMYYGNAAAASQQNVTGTWDASFRGVYHLNNSFLDATSNAYNGSNTGTFDATGKISQGRGYNRSDGADYISILGKMGTPTSVTLSVWANLNSYDAVGAELINVGDNVTFRFTPTSTDAYFYYGTAWTQTISNTTYAGAWHYITCTFASGASSQKLYVDGNEVASTTNTSAITWSGLGTNTFIGIHANGSPDFDFDGTMDEARVAGSARSAGWIITEYNNQNSPSTFYSVGSQGTFKTFTGTGNFGTAARWTGGTLPVAGDNLVIDGACTVDNNVLTDNVVYETLTIGTATGRTLNWTASGTNRLNVSSVSAGSGASSLNMTNGGTLIVRGSLTSTNLTFTPGTGTIEMQSTSSLPAAYTTYNNLVINNSSANVTTGVNTTVNGNLSITSGTFSIGAFSLAVTGTASIAGTMNITSATGAKSFSNLVINSGGTFTNTTANVPITITGNLQNDGTFSQGTGRVTFTGSTSNTVSGTAPTTDFNGGITINKGSANTNVLDVQSVITLSSGGLTLTNGTFKLSSNSIITPFTADIAVSPYLIPSSAGFWVNGGTVSTTSDITFSGLVRVSNGTLNVGDIANEKFRAGSGANLVIEGGTVNIAGRLSYVNSTDPFNFNMSGGTFNVTTVGSSTVAMSPFTINAAASTFTMSGGTIVIVQNGKSNLGYTNNAATSTVTGGTLQIGNSATPALNTIMINSTPPIWNLTINGTNSPTGQLTSALVVNNNVAISGGNINANNFNLTVKGNWVNNSSTSAFTADTATVTFDGTSTGSIGGSFPTSFNNLTINNSAGISIGTGTTVVSGTLTLTNGVLTTGSNTLSVTNNATGAITAYSASSYVNGRLQRSMATGNSYFFPVGDATSYRPFEMNSIVGTSPVVMVVMSSSGAVSFDGTITSVAARNWYAQLISGSFTSATVRITENALGSNNVVASSSAQSGNYTNQGGNSIGSTISSNTSIPYASSTYFAIGSTTTTTTPAIVLSDNGTQVTAGSVTGATTNVVLQKSALAVTLSNATLSGLTCTTAGTYASADITNLKVWYQTTNTFNAGTATLLSTLTTPGTAGSITFPSFTQQSINSGTTGYIFITTDIPCASTYGATINVNAITTANVTFLSGNKSGSTTAGGTQTIQITPGNVTGYSASNANASSILSWTNPTGCYDEIMIVAKATSSVTGTPSGNGSTYTGNLTFGSGTVFGGGYVVYKGTSSPQTVTNLTNNTTYYFKFFTRNGTNWSVGIETTVTPAASTTTTDYFRSRVSGDWATASTWESSPNNSTWINATLAPTSAANTITIRNGHNVTVTASVSIDQTTVEATGQVTVNSGQTLTIADGTGTDMTVNGTLVNSGTVTTTGTLALNSGSTYQHAQDGGTIPTATWDAASYCLITGATSTSSVGGWGTQSFGNLTWNCPSQSVGNQIAGTCSVQGTLKIENTNGQTVQLGSGSGNTLTAANYLQTGGTTVIGSGTGTSTTKTLTITGNFELSGGTLDIDTSTGGGTCTYTLNVGGNFTVNGGTFTRTSATTSMCPVNFNGTTTQTFSYTSGTLSGNINYNILSNAIVNFGTSVLTGTGIFTLNSGGSIITANTDGLSSSGSTGSIQTGTRTYNTGANYTYNGTAGQNSGDGLTGANNLTINNSSGVTLSNAVTVSGTFALINGKITTTGTNLLSVTNTSNSAISGGSATSFINGPVNWNLPTGLAGGSAYTIPVGAGSAYLPIVLYPTTASTTSAQVQAFAGNAGGTADGATLSAISAAEYWSVTGISGLTSSTIGITRTAAISPFNATAYCATQGGAYASAAGTAGTYGVTASNAISIGAATKYVTFGTINSCATPTTQASGINFTGVTNTEMTINWTRGNGENVVVFVKNGSDAITNPTNNTIYTANTTVGSGTQLGSSGYYCVYNSTATSVAVNGLTAGNTYYVQAFEYNCNVGSEKYYTSTATNNPNNQISYALPIVTTDSATGVSTTGAVLNGTINAANGVATTITFDYGLTTSYSSTGNAGTNSPTSATATSVSSAFTIASGLTANTLYHFRIKGVNTPGTTNGNDATFTTLSLPPTVGTGSGASSSGFTASWSVPGTQGTEAFTYTVEVSTANGGSFDANIVGGSTVTGISSAATSQTISGLNGSTTYYYRVKTINAGGNNTSGISAGIATLAASSATDYFRSKTSGNWSDVSTWESSANGTDWIDATLVPTSSANSLAIQSPHAVTLTATATAKNLTINGTLNLTSNTLTGTGTLTVSTTGILLVGGTSNFPTGFTTTTTTLNTGSTVNYNNTGIQTISGQTYSNLILSGSGAKTVTGATVNGNLVVSESATVTPDATFGVAGTTTLSGTSALTLGANNILSSTPIILNGGTFSTGTTTGYSETVGTLNLTGNSTILLGSGNHSLNFGASNGVSWTSGKILSITGWTGGYNGTTGTAGKLFVGSSNTGLSTGQLAMIRFYDGSVYYTSTILSSGEVVPNAVANIWTWIGPVSTQWSNGSNWSSLIGGVPPSGADVIISSGTYQPVVDATVACYRLTINSGCVLTITGTGAMTVSSTITNNGGTAGLVIQSTSDLAGTTGSLFNDVSAVNATGERWMTGDIWHLISPAVTGGQTVAEFVGVSPNANLIARNSSNYGLAPYSEANDSWDYYKTSGSNTSSPFGVPGKGFQVLRASGAGTGQGNAAYDGIVSFKGTLAAGNQSIGIVQTGNGWNLVGNPYPCALDISDFLTTNSSAFNSSYLAIYVANIGDKSTYGYTPINNSSALKLSSGEGFFVKSASGSRTLNFTTSMKSAISDAFKSAKIEYSGITILAETKTDKMSTSVKYISGMTNGLDPGWDAGIFNGSPTSFSIYTRLVQDNGVDFAIQCLPDNNFENLVVPVGLVAAKGITVTFKVSAINLPPNYKVYLEDRNINTFVRLDESGSTYSVDMKSSSKGTGRFYLHTTQNTLIVKTDLSNDLKIIPLPQYQMIKVIGEVNLPANAVIYDMTGRIITSRVLTGSDLNEIPFINAISGIYQLKIVSKESPVFEKFSWIKN